MDLAQINDILTLLENDRKNGRAHILSLSAALIDWMGFAFAENDKPRLLDFQTLKLKEALAPAPITGQEQLYRLTADGQNIRVRFAVLKKFDKKTIQYLVDNNVGLTSYQASMRGIKQIEGREPFVAQQPYFVHFITTAKYDRLWMVFNEGEQKRVLAFRHRLSQTQYHKILPEWRNISAKSKPEMAQKFWKSLDVKEVNKDFYIHVKEQFDALVGIAKTQTTGVEENVLKQFAVRLIGRYIFCWFLKEKEIIPEALISSNTIGRYQGSYFQTLLYKLFFQTLNAEVTDSARTDTITELDDLYKNIPYLNGGLFDWHDKEDFLFEKLDLNVWLVAFVQVLESFDFTVDESSSQYQQIAIDPEMLGRIFENLLASQNPDTEKMANQRKAFGAFYTPREIVDYMVTESLKAYVETQLLPPQPERPDQASVPKVAYEGTLFQDTVAQEPVAIDYQKAGEAERERKRERLKPRIDKLFASDCSENPFDKDETIQLRKTLSEISVLDPACGSGAFPMGVMLRLMELRQIIGHGHRNNYDLKEEILSKNIFGVDIMPMAVEIARLRAWLSLVLEAEYKPTDRKNNFGIAALPNLDFKFVCANSLIDSGYEDFIAALSKTAGYGKAAHLNEKIKALEHLRDSYFDPRGDKNKKKELQQEFLKTKDYIKAEFESLRKNWNLEDFLNKVDDWNPFDDSHPSTFFSPAWMFGIRHGFDVVIGNPPYVQMQKDGGKLATLFQGSNYKTFERTGDVYALFYELGFNVLKREGVHTFITSSQWLKANYGKSLRKLFLSKNPLRLIALGPGVFESAVVDTTIMISKNGNNNHQLTGSTIDKPEQLNELQTLPWKPMPYVTVENWAILDDTKQSINEKIRTKGKPLSDWELIINRGILTGYNEAFIIDQAKRDELIAKDPECDEIIRPILRGRGIDKYISVWDGDYIINTHNGLKRAFVPKINIDAYPALKAHFDSFGSTLVERADQGDTPYNLRNCAYAEAFSKEKIVWKRIGSLLRFSYSKREIYTLDSTCIATGEKIKYLTALLNSKLCHYQLVESAPKTGMGDLIISVQALEPLLVYYPTDQEQKHIEGLVDEIIQAKISHQDTTALEREIDLMVYHLYNLDFEEVLIIDPTVTEAEFKLGNEIFK